MSFSPRLLVFTRLQPPRLSADGWKRKGGGDGGWEGLHPHFLFLPVSLLALYPALPYADLPRKTPCASEISAGNTGGKHRVRLNIKSIQRAAAETFKPSAAGAHSCRAKEPLWQNTAAGRGGLKDE